MDIYYKIKLNHVVYYQAKLSIFLFCTAKDDYNTFVCVRE